MQLSLEGLIALFDLWHNGTHHHALFYFQPVVADATADGSTTLTVSGGHELVVGTRIRFTGSPPAPLNTTSVYYVVETPSSTQFRISTTRGGSPISVSSGTASYQEQPLSGCDPLAVWARHELNTTGYQREAFTYGPGQYNEAQQVVTAPTVEITRSGATLSYTHAATIRGGNNTPRSSVGVLQYWQSFGGVQTVDSTQSVRFSVTPRLLLVPPTASGLDPCAT